MEMSRVTFLCKGQNPNVHVLIKINSFVYDVVQIPYSV